jgi:hypothetical protein
MEGERRDRNLRTTTIRICWTSHTGLTLVLAPVTLKISQALQNQRGGTLKGEPQRSNRFYNTPSEKTVRE